MRSFWVQTLAATGLVVTVVIWITYGNVPLSHTSYFSEVRKVLDEVVSRVIVTRSRYADTPTEPREQYHAQQDALIANRPENDPQIPEETTPRWVKPPRPTVFDYPLQALNDNVSGYAAVECTVTRGGHPTNCQVLEELPEGYGFGPSAVRIVSRGQLTRLPEGVEETKFTVRVPFDLHN